MQAQTTWHAIKNAVYKYIPGCCVCKLSFARVMIMVGGGVIGKSVMQLFTYIETHIWLYIL